MSPLPRFALLSCALALGSPALAEDAPSREHLAPRGMEGAYHVVHYTPVVKIGNQVIVSGIPAGRGETDEDKIRFAFAELKRHLETAGATLADVVELRSFHLAADSADFHQRFAPVAKVHAEFFPSHYPAWTAVGTTALLQPGAPLELAATAIIGSGANPRAEIPKPAPRPAPTPAPAD
jgi:enamine deaminase RidA (YjgF/YER057c/UK114 family)